MLITGGRLYKFPKKRKKKKFTKASKWFVKYLHNLLEKKYKHYDGIYKGNSAHK